MSAENPRFAGIPLMERTGIEPATGPPDIGRHGPTRTDKSPATAGFFMWKGRAMSGHVGACRKRRMVQEWSKTRARVGGVEGPCRESRDSVVGSKPAARMGKPAVGGRTDSPGSRFAA